MDNENFVERPPTPPHRPTAGVRMLYQEIEDIVSFALPECTLSSVKEIPPGQSYNNRIYFLKLTYPASKASLSTDPSPQPEQVVLKVNGRFFGGNKIQNEVSCFHLLQRYCPQIPSPRALAWSEDGRVATQATSTATGTCSAVLQPSLGRLEHSGWILMSHVAGNPIPTASLSNSTVTDLARQLGDHIACMRKAIPTQKLCGNIRLSPRKPRQLSYGTPLTIRDIIHDGVEINEPITTANEYYRVRLMEKLRMLETSDTFSESRPLVGNLRDFILKRLPHLQLTDGEAMSCDEFVLTHYDLSPRNILVSGQPPRITGIVDFEFSGFFPPTEEFLNDVVNNSGDWPRGFYEAYLARLFENGVATPVRGFDPDMWNRYRWLETLVGSIAPWYLPGGLRGEELQAKVRDAEAHAREVLRKLGWDHDK
jgi:hypothetical protein